MLRLHIDSEKISVPLRNDRIKVLHEKRYLHCQAIAMRGMMCLSLFFNRFDRLQLAGALTFSNIHEKVVC